MNDRQMSFFSHFREFKNRLLICIIAFIIFVAISYIYAKNIYDILMMPLQDVIGHDSSRKFIYTNLTEVFFTYLKLSLFAGFILSVPVFVSQIYFFISPGLYDSEKKFLIPFLVMSPVLFILGGLFVYYFIFPLAWQFFISFEVYGNESVLPIMLEAKVSEYLSLVIAMIIAFGLAFQIPVILILMVKFRFIDIKWLQQKRKISVVIIFILAAILTPPDVISQIALAIPMLLLYEISIITCKYLKIGSN